MNTGSPNHRQAPPRRHQEGRLSRRNQHMRQGGEGVFFTPITLAEILHHIRLGLSKLAVALRYQFHRLTAGVLSDIRLPWYKIAVALIILFIMAKKDIQFSINMKAPLPAYGSEEGQSSQMSLARPIALKMQESTVAATRLDEQRARAYINRFRKVAAAEMEKFGIPASIKMAQGLLESRAGEHPQARQANNHFGAPLAGQAFDSAWENWRAHSLLLQQEYPALFRAGTSYKDWLEALGKSGYSSDGAYAKKLAELIERFELYALDQF